MNTPYEALLKGDAKLSLIGLGYVGIPIAVAFARKVNKVAPENWTMG